MMTENNVVLAGQKLAGPFDLGGWRDLYANPAPGANGAVDLYFTASPTYLTRLQSLKSSMDSIGISASFVPPNSEEFGAFSQTSDIGRVLEEGDRKVRSKIAERSLERVHNAALLIGLSSSVEGELSDRVMDLSNRMIRAADSELSFLDDLDEEPVANKALLKAAVPRERLEAFLSEHFSPDTTQEVLKGLSMARSLVADWSRGFLREAAVNNLPVNHDPNLLFSFIFG